MEVREALVNNAQSNQDSALAGNIFMWKIPAHELAMSAAVHLAYQVSSPLRI